MKGYMVGSYLCVSVFNIQTSVCMGRVRVWLGPAGETLFSSSYLYVCIDSNSCMFIPI